MDLFDKVRLLVSQAETESALGILMNSQIQEVIIFRNEVLLLNNQYLENKKQFTIKGIIETSEYRLYENRINNGILELISNIEKFIVNKQIQQNINEHKQHQELTDFRKLTPKKVASGLWGYVDNTNIWQIRPQFRSAGEFNNKGLAIVRLDSDFEVFIFINSLSQIVNKDVIFKEIGTVSEGLLPAFCLHKFLFGFLDDLGEWKIKPRFTNAKHFIKGLSVVSENHNSNIGFIDKSGDYIVEPIFSNLKIDALPHHKDSGHGFIDKELSYEGNKDFFVAALNGKYGVLSFEGDWLIEPKYEGFIFIKQPDNGKTGNILAKTPEHHYVESNEILRVGFTYLPDFYYRQYFLFEIFDAKGNKVFPSKVFGAHFFDFASNTYFLISEKDNNNEHKWGVVKGNGEIFFEPIFNQLRFKQKAKNYFITRETYFDNGNRGLIEAFQLNGKNIAKAVDDELFIDPSEISKTRSFYDADSRKKGTINYKGDVDIQ